MNQGSSDDMAHEVDFTGGVRGKYLARYQRVVGLTTAYGPITLSTLSTGEPSGPKIVMAVAHHSFRVSYRAPEIIAPEAATRGA